ncbi:MAG: hypothetical protein DRH57_06175 [Candidatus Cloacimonadota bacterium]|nr:MAG: hypothetical protein DRH57_06175 [Candidatus Cloacimonadota bacterium]
MDKVFSFRLHNNLLVICANDKSNPLVSIQLWVRIGSNWETDENAGYSHFIEHIVFKGTKKFAMDELSQLIPSVGGEINAFTEYDATCYYVNLPSESIAVGMEVISQLCQFPLFNEEQISKEKNVVIEELKESQMNPNDKILRNTLQHCFTHHRYGRDIAGTIEQVKNITRKKIITFFKNYYTPDNSFLTISGDFNQKNIEYLVEKYFSKWTGKSAVKIPSPIEKPCNKYSIKTDSANVSGDYLNFSFPIPSKNTQDFHILNLLFDILTNKRSILYKELHLDKNLVDAFDLQIINGLEPGLAIIETILKDSIKPYKIIKIILDTIINFKKGNIDINEIEDTKAETIFSHRYSFEYIEYLGIAISFQEIYSKYSDYFKFEQKIRKVNRKQINEIAHKYLDINQLKITHFGKNKLDIEKVEEIITQAQQKPFSIKKKNKKLEIATLDNGLKIVLKKTKYKPVVGLGLSVGVSQLNENANNLGINNLTASLILKGNEKYTFNELMNNLARNGIHFAIIPNMNNTSIVMKCFTERLTTSLRILQESLLYPTFPQNEIDKQKNTIYSILRKINDYPNSYCHVLWRELIFGKNSNLVQKIGYKETIEEITRQHIQSWYNQFFKANNITLSIVGDIDFEKVLYTCDAFLGKLPKGENHIQNLAIKKPSTEHYREKNLHHSFNTQSIIVLGGFAPNLFSQDKTAFLVLGEILGGGMNSRLFISIREKLGLVYDISFSSHLSKEFGIYTITALTSKANEKIVIQKIKEKLQNIVKNGINDEELSITINQMKGSIISEFESNLYQAQSYAIAEQIGLGYMYVEDKVKRLENVRKDEIQKLANQYFNDDNFYLQVVR